MNARQTSKVQWFTLVQALSRADEVQAERQAAIEREIAEIAADGVPIAVSASELLKIELAGMVFDFGSGRVQSEVL